MTNRTKVARTLRGMTDALQLAREGKKTNAYHYSNEIVLISYAVQGKAKPVIDRSALSRKELNRLAQIQEFNTQLIQAGLTYSERKDLCRRAVEGGHQ